LKDYNVSEIRKISPVLHLLYPSCGLQTRYSEYHVSKVQIVGKAEYLLIPAQFNRFLFPFPYGHPFRRQSQVNLYRHRKQHDSVSYQQEIIQQSISNISLVYQVTLEKGEVLMIPPGYFLHTEAKSLSMSVDILAPSMEQMILLEILSLPIPCLLERKSIFINNTSSSITSSEKYLNVDESIVCTQVRVFCLFFFSSLTPDTRFI
jgi:hypothetical protein